MFVTSNYVTALQRAIFVDASFYICIFIISSIA